MVAEFAYPRGVVKHFSKVDFGRLSCIKNLKYVICCSGSLSGLFSWLKLCLYCTIFVIFTNQAKILVDKCLWKIAPEYMHAKYDKVINIRTTSTSLWYLLLVSNLFFETKKNCVLVNFWFFYFLSMVSFSKTLCSIRPRETFL